MLRSPLLSLKAAMTGIPAGPPDLPGLVRDPEHGYRIVEPGGTWLLESEETRDASGGTPGRRTYVFRRTQDGALLTINLSADGTRDTFTMLPDDGEHCRGCAFAPAKIDRNGDRSWYRRRGLHRDDGPAVEKADGGREWHRNGYLHRDDGPAIETAHGHREWWVEGRKHRIGAPAVTDPSGLEEWWENGLEHREDGPAFISPNGTEVWYRHGVVHREGGPAVIHADGKQEWKLAGVHHREDGPAFVTADVSTWYRHGVIHREGGPAIEGADGEAWLRNGVNHRTDGPAVIRTDGFKEWWIQGRQISEAAFERFHGGAAGGQSGAARARRVADAMNRR